MANAAKNVADALLGRTEALKQVHVDGWYSTKMLTIATAMLPQHTREALRFGIMAGGITITIIDWHDYGWIVYAQYEENEIEDLLAAGHKEFVELAKFAHEEGFTFIRFDADAETLPTALGFPEFP